MGAVGVGHSKLVTSVQGTGWAPPLTMLAFTYSLFSSSDPHACLLLHLESQSPAAFQFLQGTNGQVTACRRTQELGGLEINLWKDFDPMLSLLPDACCF